MRNGVRSMAPHSAPIAPAVPTKNRFSTLIVEESDECDIEEAEPESLHLAKTMVTNVKADTYEHELLRIKGKRNGHSAIFLLDSGSTHDFITEDFLIKYGLDVQSMDETLHVTLADGSTCERPLKATQPLKVVVGDFSDQQQFTVFSLSRYDAILGKPWLTRNNPDINFKTNKVQLGGTSATCITGPHWNQVEIENVLISGR